MSRLLNQIKHTFFMVSCNKLRTILTSLGIIIVVCFFTITLLQLENEKEQVKLEYSSFPDNSILVTAFGVDAERKIRDAYGSQSIISKTSIQNAVRYLPTGLGEINLSIRFVDNDYLLNPVISQTCDSLEVSKIIGGREFSDEDSYYERNVAHIYRRHANLLFGVNKGLGESIKLYGHEYTIVGILEDTLSVKKQKNNSLSLYSDKGYITVYVPQKVGLKHMENDAKMSSNDVMKYGIMRFDGVSVVNVCEVINADVFKRGSSYEFTTTKELKAQDYSQRIEILDDSLGPILIGILALASLVIMVVMLFSIKDRFFEIGMKRALGASKTDIQFQLLLEGNSYGLIGSLIGGLMGIIVSLCISIYNVNRLGFLLFVITPKAILLPFCYANICVMICSLIPAIVYSRLNIVKCLKVD